MTHRIGTVAGFDGWSGGWVGVVLRDGVWERAVVAADFATALSEVDGAGVVGVDMPIGLTESGPRESDLAAKQLLGPRSVTVFLTPPRPALAAATYAEARAVARDRTGHGISAQAYALRRRILELDPIAPIDDRIYEVHPELAFRRLNHGQPVPWPKKTWAGHAHRHRLLGAAGISIPDDVGPAGRVPPDDLLDAAAVAHSATMIGIGVGCRLPPEPSDRIGGIWY